MNTIYGVAIGDGVALKTTIRQGTWGPLIEKRWWTNELHEIRTRQASRIPVNINHWKDETVGEVVHMEIAGNPERLWVVAHVSDEIVLPAEEDTFFSVETTATEDGREIEVTGLGLVAKSAQLGLTPLQLRRGDLAYRGASRRWTGLSRFEAGLLGRAEEARFYRPSGGPILVRHAAHSEQDYRPVSGAEKVIAATLSHDMQLADDDLDWQSKPLRHRPGGRILDVR